MSAESASAVSGPRRRHQAATAAEFSRQRGVWPPLSPVFTTTTTAGERSREMNCILCGMHYAGAGEICCDCRKIAFPHAPAPPVRPRPEVLVPQPIA
jgi:hypothetical protein